MFTLFSPQRMMYLKPREPDHPGLSVNQGGLSLTEIIHLTRTGTRALQELDEIKAILGVRADTYERIQQAEGWSIPDSPIHRRVVDLLTTGSEHSAQLEHARSMLVTEQELRAGLDLANASLRADNSNISLQLAEMRAALADQEELCDGFMNFLSGLRTAKKTLTTKDNTISSALTKATAELKSEQRRCFSLETEVANLKAEKHQLFSDLEYTQSALDKKDKECANLMNTVSEFKQIEAHLTSQLTAVQSAVELESDRCSDLNERLSVSDALCATLSAQLDDAKAALVAERQRCTQLDASLSVLQAEREGLLDLQSATVLEVKTKQDALTEALDNLAEGLARETDLSSALSAAERREATLAVELRTRDASLVDALVTVTALRSDIADLEIKRSATSMELQKALEAIAEQNAGLQRGQASLHELQNRYEVLSDDFHHGRAGLQRMKEARSAAERTIASEKVEKEAWMRKYEDTAAHVEDISLSSRQQLQKIQVLTEELQGTREKYTSAGEEIKDLSLLLETVECERDKHRQRFDAEKKTVASVKAEVSILRSDLERAQAMRKEATDAKSSAESLASERMASLQAECEALQEKNDMLQGEVKFLEDIQLDAERRLKVLRTKKAAVEKQNKELTDSNETVDRELINMVTKAAYLHEQCDMATTQLQMVRMENENLRARLKNVQEEVPALALEEAQRINRILTEKAPRCRCQQVLVDVSNVQAESGAEKGSSIKRWDSFWKRKENVMAPPSRNG